MDDQADVVADPNRPEVFVLCLGKFVKLQARVLRVYLQVKGRGLYGLLLFAGDFGQAVGEGVGYEELHYLSGQK